MSFRCLVLALAFLVGCSSAPFQPDFEDVKVKNEDPPKDCKNLGAVRGTCGSVKGNLKKATADMRREAANRGANYVRFEKASDMGTYVTGTAFKCP